jgi:hypothetical protein
MLEHVPEARNDYLNAINPKRPDFTVLINIPLVQLNPDEGAAAHISGMRSTASFLHGTCHGIVPYPW